MVDELAFPRTAKYDERWIRENALGENALCQAESLARHLPFEPGMRVLELGCGKATSSIFLAREFEVQVWATDSGTSATENFHRAIALECETCVFPMRVDAHSLPFAKEFFDAVVEWWKLLWQKTGLVDVQCAQFLPESDQLLRNYWIERPPDQDKDPIMRAVPNDDERLIGLFCLVARKR